MLVPQLSSSSRPSLPPRPSPSQHRVPPPQLRPPSQFPSRQPSSFQPTSPSHWSLHQCLPCLSASLVHAHICHHRRLLILCLPHSHLMSRRRLRLHLRAPAIQITPALPYYDLSVPPPTLSDSVSPSISTLTVSPSRPAEDIYEPRPEENPEDPITEEYDTAPEEQKPPPSQGIRQSPKKHRRRQFFKQHAARHLSPRRLPLHSCALPTLVTGTSLGEDPDVSRLEDQDDSASTAQSSHIADLIILRHTTPFFPASTMTDARRRLQTPFPTATVSPTLTPLAPAASLRTRRNRRL